MDIPIPDEPKDIKNFIREVRMRLGSSRDINYDNLAVWAFNELPRYLWSRWRGILRKHGISWQDFLKVLSFHTTEMVNWALYDSIRWTDLISSIVITIKRIIAIGGLYRL